MTAPENHSSAASQRTALSDSLRLRWGTALPASVSSADSLRAMRSGASGNRPVIAVCRWLLAESASHSPQARLLRFASPGYFSYTS